MKEEKIDNLQKRLLGYSLTSAAILGAGSANAQVIGTSVNQTLFNSTYTISFSGNDRFRFSQSTFTGVMGTTNTGAIKPLSNSAGWVRNYGTHPKALASGYIVSAGKSFNVPGNTNVNRFLSYRYTNILHGSSTPLGGSFVGAGNKYIGVKFKISSSTYYGWVKINVPSRVSNLQIISYAYESTEGISIIADGVLAVELVSFSAVKNQERIMLNWKTATEVNNYGFEIERNKYPEMQNGETVVSQWEKIGFVNGHGNSNSPKDYSFDDESAPTGLVMYRLKQIDNDGKYEYSKIVTIGNNTIAKYALAQNYPNPFNPATTIRYSIPKSEHVTMKVYNELGKEVSTLVNETKEAGNYNVTFNGAGLASGIYYYRITAGDFTEVKKLMLLK
jgi:Secretion system C-terminal sorting domain